MNNLIKDIAECERPYEKAISYGVNTLSDAELIAIILRTGTKSASSIDLANAVLNAHLVHKGLNGLFYLQREDLVNINGIGDTKATMLLALAEINKRILAGKISPNKIFDNPKIISDYYINKCKYYTTEHTFAMFFNNAHMLIKEVLLSEGTVNFCAISPREILILALKYEACNFVIIHNHPSGVPTPSEMDIKITKKIKAAGQLIDINLSDHIIIGNDCYVSLFERGLI